MLTILQAHRIETTLNQDGTLTLEQLPFQAGQAVEVIILSHPCSQRATNPYPLRGTPVRLDQTTQPVAQEDWDALR